MKLSQITAEQINAKGLYVDGLIADNAFIRGELQSGLHWFFKETGLHYEEYQSSGFLRETFDLDATGILITSYSLIDGSLSGKKLLRWSDLMKDYGRDV